ncbi:MULTISPECIES: hypothetical protein [Burkholderia]|uniref:hypothetical protein n=1 Tax=Burkholderia TaxID=32008 RepID=UPI0011786331|nr:MULTISPECIES: hypothetical protein [Burkholderia]MBY4728875.1 hypothetical protein [Burkholderia contaminans]MCI3968255.1 hypothetical protein [Burkholderia sp. HI4860]MDN7788243.1 hypothetical protein [Burkholderia contaminans]
MKKLSAWKIFIFFLWVILAIWVIFRNPSQSTAKEKLEIMVGDLSYLLKNSTILSRHENAKSGAALALYNVDASNFDEEKSEFSINP